MINKNILLVVEGEKIEPKLMNIIFKLYFDSSLPYKIYSFKTNIYVLYNTLQKYAVSGKIDYNNIDLTKVFSSLNINQEEKDVLSHKFTDILLIFDFDPQDLRYNAQLLTELVENFNESTELGKLYINYPMVESYKHFHCLPDPLFKHRFVSISSLKNLEYKKLVSEEAFQNDARKMTRENFNQIIIHNIEKMTFLLRGNLGDINIDSDDFRNILQFQANELQQGGKVFVLNTCLMFIFEYNKELIWIS